MVCLEDLYNMNNQSNRGGRREGAGRRPTDAARVNLTVRVSPITQKRIAMLRERGIRIGQCVDEMVETLYLSTVPHK